MSMGILLRKGKKHSVNLINIYIYIYIFFFFFNFFFEVRLRDEMDK